MENKHWEQPGSNAPGSERAAGEQSPKRGLHLLLGRAGSGKTAMLTESIVNHIRRGERALLIVPEQHTFDAERRIAEAAGGLIGVQVLSMERLAERTLAQCGDQRTYLTRRGVCLAIRRSCLKRAGQLLSFGRIAKREKGFTSEMAKLIAALKQAGITSEMLMQASQQLAEKRLLSDKLHDVALICSDLDELMGKRFLTVDDALNNAMDKLPNSFAAGIPVYIDGIPAATGQMFNAIGMLMSAASSVTVALTVDPRLMDGNGSVGDGDIFEPDLLACERLAETARRIGLPVWISKTNGRRKQAEPLALLERELFCSGTGSKEGHAQDEEKTDAVTLCEMPGIRGEVSAMCDSIFGMLREGIPLSDMEVIVTDTERYMPVIETVCFTHGIPIYADTRRPLTGHGAARLMLDAVAAVATGYRDEEVLSLAKSGYAGISAPEAELFENYVLRTRTRYKMFFKTITRDENAEQLDEIRIRLTEPLKRLEEGLKAPLAGEKARAVYGYLNELGVKDNLSREADALERDGRVPEAERFSQVWEAIVGLLEQIDLLLGDTETDIEEFRALLEEGIADLKVGVVPDSTGALMISPLPRAGMTSVPVQFILGCSDGLFPKDHTDDGILNDAERQSLRELNCPELTGSDFVARHERLLIYETLARPTKRLWMSYPLDGVDGMQKSALFARVGELVPNHTKIDVSNRESVLPSCRYEALMRLSDGLSYRAAEREIPRGLAVTDAWFRREEPALRDRLKRASENSFGALLPGDLTRKLYGAHLTMSASRLEQFNECPFKHFMNYGLNAQPRKVYEESKMDLGIFYHDALNAFFRFILQEKIDIRSMDDDLREAIVSKLLPDVIRSHNERMLEEDPRTRATLFLLERTVRQCIKAAVGHLQAGGFVPKGSEVAFGPGKENPPILLLTEDGITAELTGKIDRVDMAAADGSICRIIDYKTSGESFSFGEIRDGLALQLPLYLLAVQNRAPQKGKTAGIYFMPIRIKSIDEKEAPTEEKLAEMVKKEYLLRGLTLGSPEILKLTDSDCQDRSFTSNVVASLKIKTDGAFSSKAIVAGEEDFIRVLEEAKRKSAETLGEMMHGHWEASPVDKKCDYCPYKSVCRFDERLPGCRRRPGSKAIKLDEFLSVKGVPAK